MLHTQLVYDILFFFYLLDNLVPLQPKNTINLMYGNTDNITALPNEENAKKMKEMAIKISRLESEVERWKESAYIKQCNESCLVLSYDKLRDTLYSISDFTFSSSLSTVMQLCLPDWATEEDSNKVAELIPLFPKMKKRMPATTQKIPNELRTEKALEIKEKLMDAGMINENWQPVNLTNTESSMMAKVICEMLSISNPWKLFGNLWNRNPDALRSSFNKALEQRKTLVFQDKLKRII